MTYQLSAEQSAWYEEGNWASRRVEEDVLEWMIHKGITAPIVVLLDNGSLAYTLTSGEVL